MLGPGWFYDQNGSLVHESDMGAFVGDRKPVERMAGSPGTRAPITSTFRRIGNPSPGVWNDVKAWWAGLKPEYRYGIFGGLAAIGVIIAACQKGGGKTSSVKRI